VVEDVDVAWICELGSQRMSGSFTRFVDSLAAARVRGDVDQVIFESPSLGRIETGWQRDFTVAGQSVMIHDYPRFDNPYCQAAFGVPLTLPGGD